MTGGPLAGAGVVVTRPRHLAGELEAAIASAGGHAVSFPVMDIVPRQEEAVAADRARLPAPDIVIFISRNAVLHGVETLGDARARIAAIGPATRDALAAAGRRVDIAPEGGFDSESLLAEPALRDVGGLKVRIVRGTDGRELLADTLRARGAVVDYLAVYERVAHDVSRDDETALTRLWLAGGVRYVVVMSGESLEFLLRLLPAECRARLAEARLVTPAERVIKTAIQRVPGIRTVLAASPAAHHLVAAMVADRAPINGTGA